MVGRNATAEEWNEWQRRMKERDQQEELFRKAHAERENDEKKEYNERFFRRTDGATQFTHEHFVSIREIFEIPNGNPLEWAKHDQAIVHYQGGLQTIIEPNYISFSGGATTDEQYRDAIKYVQKHWKGEAHIDVNPNTSREFRLKSLAYAEVYGIKIFDHNNNHPDLALTKVELARLPELCAHIRRIHPDAPPARPDNGRTQPDAPANG